ncbi:Rhomboid family protein [Cognatiyoonia koreensis]|uniref:Rhomboid family protein n=1 Tax=Cognatiyoonia koreensis TaxID=364200 RepID=A0A1I0QLL1_9RHOB|nr:rhomboid family intramembrane serine protease [Cognatiyoonia koreensis]SEW27927.1 Rhomboid family protein [Cognatiyoonia koreensis]
MDNQSPFNALPPVVVALVLIIVVVELIFTAGAQGLIGGPGAIGWRLEAVRSYAFAPSVSELVFVRGDYSFEVLKRFVTFSFVHASFLDAMFGMVLTLALGKFVGDAFGNFATGFLFFFTAAFGALVYGLFLSGFVPLIGAYPAAYGLIGAYTYLIWLRLGESGENQLAAFRLIGFLLGLQLFYGIAFGSTPQWIAELAGFFSGFAVAPLLAPGGWQAFVARMRRR